MVVVLYGVGIFGGFIQDDLKVIPGDPEMGRVTALASSFTRPYYYMDGGNAGAYRPITSFSFYLNALLTGNKAWGFRLVNILLYANVCLLIFELLKKLFSKNIAFLAAMLFIVLPIHTEAVNNIVGRAEILSLGFVILAILKQEQRKWEMSAGMFLLALFSKETAIIGLPILIYLIILRKETIETKMGIISFYVLIMACYLVLRIMILGSGGLENNATMVENPLKYVTTSQRVMNAFSLVPFGIGKVFFPFQLSYDYSFNELKLMTNWFNRQVIIGIGLVLLSLGSMFTNLRKNKIWVLGQVFFWGPLIITGNFVFPIGTIFGERLWFWPSLGLVMMVVSIINRYRFIHWFHSLTIMMSVLVMVFFVGRTFVRNLNWLSQDSLFIHDASYVKESVLTQNNAAAMYMIRNDLVKGKEYLDKADTIYPKYPELMNNWGMYFLWKGDKEKSRQKFEECLIEKPGYYLCESNINLLK